jgi:hypothetical protein
MRFRTRARSDVEGSTSARKGRRISRKTRGGILFTGLLLLVAAGLLFAVPALSNTGPPTISSDQADYAPGSTVTLSGSNWQPGEDVHISVNDNVGQTWSYSADVTADAGGAYTNQFQLPTSFVASYLVTATGLLSGTATTTFTDSAANLDQCTNGAVGATPEPCVNDSIFTNWVNGNVNGNKAHWAEDEFLPYRATIDGITAGGHTLSIVYDTVNSGEHAIDYLGSFDASETTSATSTLLHANSNDPCSDKLTGALAAECTPGNPTGSLHIPNPTLVNCGGSAGAAPSLITGSDSDRSMKIWGPPGTTVTGMSYFAQNVVHGGNNCSTTLKISFSVGGSDSSNTVVLAWSGHIARGDGFNGWGAGDGAGSVSGSPYHMAFDTNNGNPDRGFDGASQGAQDRALQAGPPNGAIIPSSTITIVKHTSGGNDTFSYTTTGGGGLPPSFDITTSGGTGQQVNSGINPGTYTIDEPDPLPAGWSFTSLSCTTNSGGATTSTSGRTATVNIPITGNSSVTCTYTNTRAASVEVIKSLDPTSDPGLFNLQVNSVTKAANVGDGGDTGVVEVPAGSNPTVGETQGTDTLLSNYASSISCTGDSSASGSGTSLSVGTLQAGQSAVCTITNHRLPQLKVIKTFVGDPNGLVDLKIDSSTYDNGGAGFNTTTTGSGFQNVATGTHTVAEIAHAGSGTDLANYDKSISCDNSKGSNSGATSLVTNALAYGDKVTCTITNSRLPTLTVIKHVQNNNGGGATAGQWSMHIKLNGSEVSGSPFNGAESPGVSKMLSAGTYVVSETGSVYGYSFDGFSGACNSSGAVTLAYGDNKTCTLTNNDQPGTIVIIKNATPTQGVFSFDTTGSTNGPGTSWPTGLAAFTLTGSTANNGNRRTFTVDAGTYTVKEQTQLGWLLTGIGGSTDPLHPYDCVVGSGGSTGGGVAQSPQTPLDTRTVSIAIKNGDTVTCTFENTGNGATRTQGFWATHPQLANIAWVGGSEFGHTFPGVAGTVGNLSIDGAAPCPRLIDTLGKLMGGFWSSVSTKSNGSKRSALDQARMQLAQQLLAAELNTSAFGSAPAGGVASFTTWESAFCGTNQNAIKNAQQGAASFNSQGDTSTFTPGTSADSKTARSIANIPYWDVLP